MQRTWSFLIVPDCAESFRIVQITIVDSGCFGDTDMTDRDINGQRYQRAANGPAEQDEETA